MALHLLKLCVGLDSVAELESHVAERLRQRLAKGEPRAHIHTTRMIPKRVDELLDAGSLYWVVRGQIAARQLLRDIRPIRDTEGVPRCQLVLEPEIVAVEPRPCRPFQGWRYMDEGMRPRDLDHESGGADMPEQLRHALRELCLL